MRKYLLVGNQEEADLPPGDIGGEEERRSSRAGGVREGPRGREVWGDCDEEEEADLSHRLDFDDAEF